MGRGPAGKGASHLHHSLANVDLTFDTNVLECLGTEPVLAQRLVTTGHGAQRRPGREDAVDARLTHLVVAFRIDQEAHVRVQVA